MKNPALFTLFSLTAFCLFLGACAPVTTQVPDAALSPTLETPQLITPVASNLATETPLPMVRYQIPNYYPETYISTVEDSKGEDGLVIFANMSDTNWQPIIEAFNAHYPWIKVTTREFGPEEVMATYLDDISKGQRSADLVISSDPVSWFDLINKKEISIYHSMEELLIPDWAKSAYSTYCVSSEPMVIIYNKRLVAKPPSSMAELAAIVQSDTSGLKQQVVTTDAELNVDSFSTNWFWADKLGQSAWTTLNSIGRSQPVLMASEADIINTVGKGDARLGYFISVSKVVPLQTVYPDLGWSYITDGQPVLLRNMGITKGAVSPFSARLMVDFILSQEGQYAVSLGGLTPYRSDISELLPIHFDKITETIGEDSMIIFSLDARLLVEANRSRLLENWRTAVNKISVIASTPTPAP